MPQEPSTNTYETINYNMFQYGFTDPNPPAGDPSPLTTKGDLYTYDTDNQRLPVGADGFILSANSATSTGLEWIVAPSGSPLTTKGDLLAFDTADVRLPVGADGLVLTANSATSTGLEWAAAGGPDVTLVGPQTFYWDVTTGNDVTGDGSIGNPWLTPAPFADLLEGKIISGGNITLTSATVSVSFSLTATFGDYLVADNSLIIIDFSNYTSTGGFSITGLKKGNITGGVLRNLSLVDCVDVIQDFTEFRPTTSNMLSLTGCTDVNVSDWFVNGTTSGTNSVTDLIAVSDSTRIVLDDQGGTGFSSGITINNSLLKVDEISDVRYNQGSLNADTHVVNGGSAVSYIIEEYSSVADESSVNLDSITVLDQGYFDNTSSYASKSNNTTIETLSADKVMTLADSRIQVISTTGANRNITLPTTNVNEGTEFLIFHNDTNSGFNLTVLPALQGLNTVSNVLAEGESIRATAIDDSGGYIIERSAAGRLA